MMITNEFTRELEPFYFGQESAPLYGCFHPPQGTKRACAAVLCYPFGDEMIRVHRAYKQLALRLSRAGVAALRFDYFGWGDSAGEDYEATLTLWEQNIELAISEAQKRSGAQQVILVGLRLGASLALRIAARRQDVTGVVAWEPVVNGAVYLQALAEAHEHRLNFFLTEPDFGSPSDDITERLGFVLSSVMVAEINGLNLLQEEFPMPGQSVLLVEKNATDAAAGLRDHLQRQDIHVNYQCLDDPAIWGEDPDKALIPGQTFKAIMSWFSEIRV